MRDVENDEDIKKFVDQFYAKVNNDELLSPIFNEVVKVDWDHHMPHIYNFWSNALFGSGCYNGRPFPKHFNLPIEPHHFERWLFYFEETVNRLFKGEKASEAILRANMMADNFQHRMGLK